MALQTPATPKPAPKVTIDSLAIARTKAAEEAPYLATGIWALIPVCKPGIGTVACDKYWRMYYDPQLEWTPEELSAAVRHELWHLLRGHHERGVGREGKRWNKAGDCEINCGMRQEGATLPANVLYPQTFNLPDDLLAEEYYDRIPSDPGGKKGKPGKEGGDPGKHPGGGDCGSCSGNDPKDFEDAEGQGPGLSPLEGEMITNQVAKDVVAQKTIGSVPGNLVRWAEGILNPKVDWRKVMASVVKKARAWKAGLHDFSYHRPSRRQVPGVVMPAMREPLVFCAVVVDTSGSMGNDEIAACLAEVKGCIKAAGFEQVPVISCDSEVHTVTKARKVKDVRLEGGGGTDMGQGLKKALELKPHPDVIVVLTDGYTPWPAERPNGSRVVVGLVTRDRLNTPDVPKWATKVVIELEGKR